MSSNKSVREAMNKYRADWKLEVGTHANEAHLKAGVKSIIM